MTAPLVFEGVPLGRVRRSTLAGPPAGIDVAITLTLTVALTIHAG